jgi:hypothetical protein
MGRALDQRGKRSVKCFKRLTCLLIFLACEEGRQMRARLRPDAKPTAKIDKPASPPQARPRAAKTGRPA